MKGERFMHVDVVENGKHMMLDRKTNTFVPTETITEPGPEKYRHKPTEFILYVPENPMTPEETLEKNKKVLKEAKGLPQVKLTVGDLSFVSANKNNRKLAQQRLRAMEQNLTVGDLSWVTESKDVYEDEAQRFRAERRGLTVGDQFVGRRFTPQPTLSESQEIVAEMQARHREKRKESIKIKNLIIAEEQEKQKRKDAAAIRIRQEREQVDRELDFLLRKGKAKAHVG